MKRKQPRWDWESHLTSEESTELAALWREADQIRIRLDTIKQIEAEIQGRATGRAKFGVRVKACGRRTL